ncbi:homing endonuclease associated repeat-containing protein [Natronosalvus caseinilyticus]|uniref:homing endonuclease associated repeat-containing protein n=1 Tax=Natronosalvus caseinilyticus TaxID=2953747 RepID=UPI0028A6813A|nr:hypothetical protein [Natronosalvus caseinilyticus]
MNPNRTSDRAKRPSISEEALIDDIKRLKKRFGRPPKQKEMDKFGTFNSGTYRYRFGSWNNAILKAGFEPRTKSSGVSDEELLSELKQLNEDLDRIPRRDDITEHSKYSLHLYDSRFGGVVKSLEEAGIEVPEHRKASSTTWIMSSELIKEIQRLANEFGRPPSFSEMDEHGDVKARTISKRFGSWAEAISEAGLDPDEVPTSGIDPIPEKELLEEIRSLNSKHGKRPTATMMNEEGDYSATTYYNRFEGSWSDFVDLALDQ